ncbi:MAG: S8 family serine peptidase [Pseudomonadota bacterium]
MPLTPTDNLYAQQWYLTKIGALEDIWASFNGSGVKVGVYDDGIEYSHHDLNDNYDASLHVSVGGGVADPMPVAGGHGTAVAGIIGAELNGSGTVGVAWGSTLAGVNIFSGAASTGSGMLQALDQLGSFDVTNHSWGYNQYFTPSSYVAANTARFEAAVVDGRGGLGTINVKAAGNSNYNANSEDIQTSRAVISVAAYDNTGDASWYSNHGANILVSAPSNGGTLGQTTTDLTGDGAGDYSNGDYTSGFGGTSGASPVVAGVVALMLDANPNLGWRDVQNIIANSAHEVGSGVGGVQTSDEDHAWFYNGASTWNGGGLHFSEDYGFGSINAYNAVRMAEVWGYFQPSQTSANEVSATASIGSPVALPDLTTTEIAIGVSEPGLSVEYVNLSLDITHTWLPDLIIELVSPDGTVATLFDGDGSPSLGFGGWDWTFGANAFRGEDGSGTWTIRVTDTYGADPGILNSASLTLHGSNGIAGNADNDVYHFTDEYSDTVSQDNTRRRIDDDTGVDWINAAAVSTASVINLNGQSGTIDGVLSTFIGIENAISGDGNDRLIGDATANRLFSMRGEDTLNGGHGSDVLNGGTGDDLVFGGTARDVLRGASGADRLYGQSGNDNIDGGHGNDIAYGGAHNDIIRGGQGKDWLYGHNGNDRLLGDGGSDLLVGHAGADRAFGGRGGDEARGGAGNDILRGNDGNDRLYGGAHNDNIGGGSGSDIVSGGRGADRLAGNGGSDRFVFHRMWDKDVIVDFEDGKDFIKFAGRSGIDDMGDLVIRTVGNTTLVYDASDDGNVIRILNSAGDIGAADFIFS